MKTLSSYAFFIIFPIFHFWIFSLFFDPTKFYKAEAGSLEFGLFIIFWGELIFILILGLIFNLLEKKWRTKRSPDGVRRAKCVKS